MSKPKPDSPKGRHALEVALRRSRSELIPEAFQVLWQVARFIVLYGGRASAKSWSIARVLLTLAQEKPLRVLCVREVQSSIRESAYRLLGDQIRMLELEGFFTIMADRIVGQNGSEFYFAGLKDSGEKIRSYEGLNFCWIEEAQAVSDWSFETLIPTIVRNRGCRFFISFNPQTRDDPVARRFVDSGRADVVAKKVSWRDNPYLAPEAHAEREWLEKVDPDMARHVWEGFPREVSDALILKGKYFAEEFEVQSGWAGPYHGLDYGFARDPAAAVRCYIDDVTRTLYVDREFWALGCDLDVLPGALEAAIPGISRSVVYADAASPQATSLLAKSGIPNARSAEKWPGSIEDGVLYLRSFAHIVVSPACKHLLDECQRYSFKQDRLTGVPLPEVLDKHNHCIDALRYALSPLIRNQQPAGYFNRAAMLLPNGEPVDMPPPQRPLGLLMTLTTEERPGAGVGLIYWAHIHYSTECPLIALGYELVELREALSPKWLRRVCHRAVRFCAAANIPGGAVPTMLIEEGELLDAAAGQLLEMSQTSIGVEPIDAAELPPTLAERAAAAKLAINTGRVKVSRDLYAEQTSYRAIIANHFASQIFGYRPGADVANELTNAFVTGVLAIAGAGAATAPDEQIEDEDEEPSEERAAREHRAAVRAAAVEKFQRDSAAWEASLKAAIAADQVRHPGRVLGWRQLELPPPPRAPGWSR